MKTLFAFFLLVCSVNAFSQDQPIVRGIITDAKTQSPLVGANIRIKGTFRGTVSNTKGEFQLKTDQDLPITLIISSISYGSREIIVNGKEVLRIILEENINRLSELVVTASRKSEELSKVPVTVETLHSSDLKQIPVTSFYDAIAILKGVNTINSSIAFTVYNTRGFQHPTNLRFVQLVDGADNSSPELGLPIANTIGPGELDIQSVELIPGASSAIYGLSASNGLLNLITKDPFIHQGLSVSLKTGINNINSPSKDKYDIGASSYNNVAIRYAKAWNDKLAFKVNFGYLKGQDWASGDFNDYRDWNGNGLNDRSDPGYDGANIYGDEDGATNTLTLGGIPTKVSRTGYTERELTDYDTELLHADATVAYKPTENSTIAYTYRIGEVDNIFTRGNKLKFKNFVVQQHVLSIRTPDLSFKSYYNKENSGDSYNIRYLADAINNAAKTNAQWNEDFTAAFDHAVANGQTREQAFQTARTEADDIRILPGTAQFGNTASALKKDGSWETGARFLAKGFLWHNELIYDLSRYTKSIADLQFGGDYRYAEVNSDGTYYRDQEQTVYSYKYGAFLQAARDLDEKLRIVGSVRLDKARDLDAQFTERVGLIFTPNKRNNFHLSYQNGYRLPSFEEGYSYVPTGQGIGLGGLRSNSEPENIVRNSYNYASVLQFITDYTTNLSALLAGGTPLEAAQVQALVNTKDALQVATFDYLKPEQNRTIELSYKGSYLDDKLYVDLNIYGTQYNDFIRPFVVIKPNSGVADNAAGASDILQNNIKAYETYSNIATAVYVYGTSLGFDYNLYKEYVVSGNFSYINLDWGNTSQDALSNGFNTPKFNFNLSLANPVLYRNLGFRVLYKWTSKTDWRTDFSIGKVPAWHSLDAQVSYRIPQMEAVAALGGTNILNKYYTQYIGGPSIGGFYYISLTFDGLLTNK